MKDILISEVADKKCLKLLLNNFKNKNISKSNSYDLISSNSFLYLLSSHLGLRSHLQYELNTLYHNEYLNQHHININLVANLILPGYKSVSYTPQI